MAASCDSPLLGGTSRKFRKCMFYLMISLFLFILSTLVLMLYPKESASLIFEPVKTLKIWCFAYGVVELAGYFLQNHLSTDGEESRRKGRHGLTIVNSITHGATNLMKNGLLMMLSCAIFHLLAVLYGAPFTESVEETAMFGVLLTTLVTLPTLCILGTDLEAYSRLVASKRPCPGLETCLAYMVFCTLLGAWLGAFPIPLDWDRPWQKWPVSCSIGALLGHTVGLCASVIHSGRMLEDQAESLLGRSKSKNF